MVERLRALYTGLLILVLPWALLRLAWLGAVKHRGYWARWRERFGVLAKRRDPRPVLLVHAVSVGEVMACRPLIEALQSAYSGHQIVVTTMTPTGADAVIRELPGVTHTYLPYDLPCFVTRFLRELSPRLLILMETELWPNLLLSCRAQKIPVLLANARLSARSYGRYARLKKTVGRILQALDRIAAQSPDDAARFVALGVALNRITVTGSLKFDARFADPATPGSCDERDRLFGERPVWIAASTHKGEDEQVLEAHQRIVKEIPEALLILVPRHPDRASSVAALAQQQGFCVARHSAGDKVGGRTGIYLLDTLGELLRFYAYADLAFVGGSLVARGGHNALEPAALGVPVLSGTHIHNFISIFSDLEAVGCAVLIDDAPALARQALHWFRDDAARQRAGAAGKRLVAQQRGATVRHLALLEDLLEGDKKEPVLT